MALRGKDCVAVAVEKVVVSKLHEPDTGRRSFTIDQTIGIVSKFKLKLDCFEVMFSDHNIVFNSRLFVA